MGNARQIPRLAMNRAEVALSIGVSVNTIDKMVDEGKLPKPRRWNSRKIWLVAEIEAAMLEWPQEGPTDDQRGDTGGGEWQASV